VISLVFSGRLDYENPPPSTLSTTVGQVAGAASIWAIFQSNFGRELFYDAADSSLDTEDLISSELDWLNPEGEGP